jgi:glutamate decarboxylase
MQRVKLEAVQKQASFDIEMLGNGTQPSLQKQIMQLFTLTTESSQIENRCEKYISEIVYEFLRTTNFSSAIELSALQEQFKKSKIPDQPSDVGSYFKHLANEVVAHSIRTSSPRFIGHMTSALPYFVRPLGKLLTALNQNVVKIETAKSVSPFERQTLAMMHRLVYGRSDEFYEEHIQKNESTLGILTSGGTLANITALWCARNSCFGPQNGFNGIEIEGVHEALNYYGSSDAVVVGSALMHYSFDKAAGLLGLGTRNLKRVRTDRNHRIDLQALRDTLDDCHARNQRVFAIVGIAGTTDSGAIDPLLEMADIAQEAGIHFHVDAAWGGAVMFSKHHRHKLKGIERADSVTIDAHKQLYTPMGIGIVLLSNAALAKMIEKQARYIIRSGSADLGRRALEGSRPAMTLFLHAALNILGSRGYELLVDEGIRKAQYMAASIRRRSEFEVLIEPEINILTYRYLPEEFREKAAQGALNKADNFTIDRVNETLQRMQRKAGRNFVSRTKVEGTRQSDASIVALRAVIANPLTTERGIDEVLNEQVELAESVKAITQ